jgi:ABC-type nitrate/sulfonate/bicarbonate transport system substrate-binding protein
LGHLNCCQALSLAALGTLLAQTPSASQRGKEQPVRIGYLPITDAAPLLVAHARKMFERKGLPRSNHACSALGRTWWKPSWLGR